VFALIELLRGVAAFMFAPIVLHLAMTVGGKPPAGIQVGLWVCLGVAAGGGLLALCVFVLGRARLQRPDLERWEDGEEPAWESPPLAAGIRLAAGIGPKPATEPPPGEPATAGTSSGNGRADGVPDRVQGS
jgi:hypothetical protein